MILCSSEAIALIGDMVMLFITIFVLVLAAIFIFTCFCIYKILDYFNFEHKVLGTFVPIYQQYALCSVVAGKSDTVRISFIKYDVDRKVFKWSFLAPFIVAFIPVLGTLASLVVQVMWWATIFTYLEARIKKISIDEVNTVKQVLLGIFWYLGLFICFIWIEDKKKSK